MKLRLISIILFFTLFTICTSVHGNGSRTLAQSEKRMGRLIASYIDSLRAFQAVQDSVLRIAPDTTSMYVNDARIAQLFVPLTFFHHISADMLRIDNDGNFARDSVGKVVDAALMHIYLSRPDLVVNSQGKIDEYGAPVQEVERPLHHDIDIVDKVAPQPIEPDVTPVDVMVRKPNFWTFEGDYYLQFMQNAVSENWYKGGESSYSMVGSATFQANYNTKQGFKWENKLEMKLGFQNSKSDTLHAIKTSEDLLRYTGKVGIQATKKWYYTIQLLAYTQFMRGYKSNDPIVYSGFLSPLNVNLSIGMDYAVNWFNGRLTGTIHLAPLAYNLKYVKRLELATRYGLDEGKHTLHDFGSESTADLTWQILDNLKWKTRLYGYTTYKRTELEWENTFTFNFNRYISSNLFIYPRFDDGTARDEHHGYWQFKEYASLGFSYSF